MFVEKTKKGLLSEDPMLSDLASNPKSLANSAAHRAAERLVNANIVGDIASAYNFMSELKDTIKSNDLVEVCKAYAVVRHINGNVTNPALAR